MSKKIKFLVVDDHPVFRQGLVTLLESNKNYQVSGEAGTVEEAFDCISGVIPDIMLVDISLSHQNGLDLVRSLKVSHPDIPVLIISMHDELIYAERSLKAGARGFVMKQEASSVMLKAIATVLAGKIYLSDTMHERMLETIFSQKEENHIQLIERLSERELEVLEYIGQGYGIKEISNILNLSVKTVNTYRDHIKEKMQLKGAAEIRRFAVKWYQSRHR
ncbi:MAG: response regulator transcription factor [Spirochaetales bacterium]|nr:response regulator transcription factor [Spirochaetales bacterium]